jgi:hypothetical protein
VRASATKDPFFESPGASWIAQANDVLGRNAIGAALNAVSMASHIILVQPNALVIPRSRNARAPDDGAPDMVWSLSNRPTALC